MVVHLGAHTGKVTVAVDKIVKGRSLRRMICIFLTSPGPILK